MTMRLKPRDSLSDPLAQTMHGVKTEQLFGSTHVQAAARLSVRFSAIPHNITRKADFSGDHLGQIPNGNLFSRA
jgi:hypothetical protein